MLLKILLIGLYGITLTLCLPRNLFEQDILKVDDSPIGNEPLNSENELRTKRSGIYYPEFIGNYYGQYFGNDLWKKVYSPRYLRYLRRMKSLEGSQHRLGLQGEHIYGRKWKSWKDIYSPQFISYLGYLQNIGMYQPIHPQFGKGVLSKIGKIHNGFWDYLLGFSSSGLSESGGLIPGFGHFGLGLGGRLVSKIGRIHHGFWNYLFGPPHEEFQHPQHSTPIGSGAVGIPFPDRFQENSKPEHVIPQFSDRFSENDNDDSEENSEEEESVPSEDNSEDKNTVDNNTQNDKDPINTADINEEDPEHKEQEFDTQSTTKSPNLTSTTVKADPLSDQKLERAASVTKDPTNPGNLVLKILIEDENPESKIVKEKTPKSSEMDHQKDKHEDPSRNVTHPEYTMNLGNLEVRISTNGKDESEKKADGDQHEPNSTIRSNASS